METQFSFKANARPINERPKYRDDLKPTQQIGNISTDPRIYKGTTNARKNVLIEKSEPIPSYPKQKQTRNISIDLEKAKEGFQHGTSQTDPFEDSDVVIVKQELEIGIQTDTFHEKPLIHRKPAPLVAVGVRTNAPGSELFDFNQEVRPFVITLVQKALTQASMEVHEEEELSNMQRYLRAFEQNKKQEQNNINKIEQIELQKFEEKEKIILEKLLIEKSQYQIKSKVLTLGFSKFFIWDLENDILLNLKNKNYFYDEIEKEINNNFLPFIFINSSKEISKPLILNKYSNYIQNKSLEIINNNNKLILNQSENNINNNQNLRQNILRKMISEDNVSKKIQKKKIIENKKIKKINDNNDDDDN